MMKGNTPETIKIHVSCTKCGLWFFPGEVVTSTVKKVSEATAKLKVGDTLKIRYRQIKLKGIAPPPFLQKIKPNPLVHLRI